MARLGLEQHFRAKHSLLSRVAEGKEGCIGEWLRARVPPHSSETAERFGADTSRWRGFILCSMVSVRLVHDTSYSADSAINLVLEFCEEKRAAQLKLRSSRAMHEERVQPILFVSLWPALIKLANELVGGRYVNTNQRLFDWIGGLIRGYRHDLPDLEKDLRSARLSLVHPTRPDTELALQFIEKYCGSPSNTMPVPLSAAAQEVFRSLFFRAKTMLRRANRDADADLVEKRYNELFNSGLSVTIRKTYHQKGAQVRRRESPAGIS